MESQELNNWMRESDENKSYVESIRNIWLASAQLNTEGTSSTEKNISISKQYPPSTNTRRLNQFLKIAAVFLLLIATGVILLKQFSGNTSLPNHNIVVEATLGSRAFTTLPDGTKVWLNSGTKLYYDANYNSKTREVKLTGEAYFSVVTNPEKPFVVKAGNLNIKALGTKFNVKAYPEDGSIITTLEHGKVIIEGKDKTDKEFTVAMKPKETVTYFEKEKAVVTTDNSQISEELAEKDENLATVPIKITEEVKTELFTSWKDQRWVIEKQKLGNLARDFERRYNIRINFTSDSIKQFHFSGSFENETIEQIMVIMRHTIPIKYKIEKGIINIGQDDDLMKKFYGRTY